MRKPLENPTELGEVISQRVAERGMTIHDLSIALEVSYEHARRLIRGEGIPSKPIVRRISQVLKLNYNDLEKLRVSASLQRRYGGIPLELAGKKPSLEPIDRVWDSLTKQQQDDAISMIVGWSRAAKARG